MHNFTPIPSLVGGLFIGAAASLMLLAKGRIAGISGIVGGALRPAGGEVLWRLLFVFGLMCGPLLVVLLSGRPVEIRSLASDRVLLVSGLLVGFGTRLGSGCTSGHGVCGLARRSPRSALATALFMGTAALTVLITRHFLGGAP